MGREASCACTWGGTRGTVKALLETNELILRGEVRDRIPRASLGAARVSGETLEISVGRRKLVLELGAKAAAQWVNAIAKPPPSLAAKLGVSATSKCIVLGDVKDESLAHAINEHRTRSAAQAAVIVAVIRTEKDLASAETRARTAGLPVWCVYAKGRAAAVGDAAVRTYMRTRGFMDNKTCAVSETLTATRYALKRA